MTEHHFWGTEVDDHGEKIFLSLTKEHKSGVLVLPEVKRYQKLLKVGVPGVSLQSCY